MKTIILSSIIVCLTLVPASGQQSKKSASVESSSNGMTQELGEAILNELRQIHHLLQQQQTTVQPAPAQETAKVSAAGFSIGREDAPLTLVEFADYQCPYCRQFHMVTYERLKKEYIDSSKLRFVSRDLPLEIHNNALAAANAGRCAAEQNQFWPMRETLISHADKLDSNALEGYAHDIGLNVDQFRSCVASEKYLPSIRADIAEANAMGIMGTPTFVLGKASGGHIEGVKLVGAQPYEVFAKLLSERENR
jgi:protein-disulfide isomerase